MIPAISQICTLNSPFEDDIADFAQAGCKQVEVWLTKLEAYLKDHSLDDVRRLCEKNEVRLPVASVQGGLFAADDAKLDLAWQLFRERLALCRDLEIETLVVSADIADPLTQPFLDSLVPTLTKIASEAGRLNRRIALEFQARSTFANNLQTATALISEVGSPHLGICLDAFHFFVGCSKLSDLQLVGNSLFHVQICDLADTARELAADGERILPGDGDFDLESLIGWLRSTGYTGAVSLELMNPQIWQIPALQVGEVALAAIEKCLNA